MQLFFSSGEVLHKENVKELNEGTLVGENISYIGIEEDTEYKCLGKVNERGAKIIFKLTALAFERVAFKNNVNILMPSDIYQSNWEKYRIEWI
ncbi:MAG: hypothetical protein GX796_12005 [Clostridiaceae bacterium]|nr:hypothetical protein [Clostridiaceae bacterium]